MATLVANIKGPPGPPGTVPEGLYLPLDGSGVMTGPVAFEDETAEKIVLYPSTTGTNFAIGVQPSTHYFRTSSGFSWFKGGVHDDVANSPGVGGVVQLRIDANGCLYVPTPAASIVVGNSASSGPRLRFHVPASGDITYCDFQGYGVEGTGHLIFRSGQWQIMSLEDDKVRLQKMTYVTGQLRVAGGVQGIVLTDPTNPYIGFYQGASPDELGARAGYVGHPGSVHFYMKDELAGGGIYLSAGATSSAGAIVLLPAGTEQGRMTNTGDFCVARTSSTNTTVGNSMTQSGRIYTCTAQASSYNYIANIISSVDNSILIHFRRSDTTVGYICMNGTTGVQYAVSSHGPFKSDVVTLAEAAAVDKVRALRPISHRWKLDANGRTAEDGTPTGPIVTGFVAQELHSVIPEAVAPGHGTWVEHKEWDAARQAYTEALAALPDEEHDHEAFIAARELLPPDPGEISPFEPWAIDNSYVVPTLTRALQVALDRIDGLTARVAQLEGVASAA